MADIAQRLTPRGILYLAAVVDMFSHTGEMEEDIQGGIVFGIHTCWYNRDGLEIPRNIRPTFVIGRLRELIDLV